MWKIAVGFVIFAAAALFILSRGGNIDMGGEKHGMDSHSPEPAKVAPAAVPTNVPAPAPAPTTEAKKP